MADIDEIRQGLWNCNHPGNCGDCPYGLKHPVGENMEGFYKCLSSLIADCQSFMDTYGVWHSVNDTNCKPRIGEVYQVIGMYGRVCTARCAQPVKPDENYSWVVLSTSREIHIRYWAEILPRPQGVKA